MSAWAWGYRSGADVIRWARDRISGISTGHPRSGFLRSGDPTTPDRRPVRGRGGGAGISFRELEYSYVIRKGFPQGSEPV